MPKHNFAWYFPHYYTSKELKELNENKYMY